MSNFLTLIRQGGQISPQENKIVISLELNVGFTSNQAVNLSLSVLYSYILKIINLDRGGTLMGPFLPRVP